MVDRARLEIEFPARERGFESHPLRAFSPYVFQITSVTIDCQFNCRRCQIDVVLTNYLSLITN